jgi:glycosyltransferase involved in cell wall biosynthesis
MATAVLVLDLEQVPTEINGLAPYGHALVLIRWRGCPVGRTFMRVLNGRISGMDIRDALSKACGSVFWERWLRDYLEWNEVMVKDMVLPRGTVAVCTRDRTEDLRRCLEALIRLEEDDQELLVIDNCPSTDATQRLVAEYPRVRYVREDQRGLDVARNRALREARNDIVAFCDDDAAPDPGWLRALLRNFHDPRVLCVTGLTMPLELETEAQEWFERYTPFGRGFKRTVFDSTTHNPLVVWRAGTGNNMAVRRSVVELAGPFDELLDAGTSTRSGGDYEMFSRILTQGYRIVYDPAALSWHRHRRTWEELRTAIYGYGVGVYAAWTRSLLVEREWGVLKLAWAWFRYQIRALLRSLLRRRNATPMDLLLAELRGCAVGPWAYLSLRKRLRSR